MNALLTFVSVALGAAILWPRRALASPMTSSPRELQGPPKPSTKAPAEPQSNLPLGVRNHNPGNIRTRGTRNGIRGADPWRGLIAEDSAGYGIFDTPVNGIRALVIDLRTGFTRDGEDTVREIITEWAPPTENNTAAYIAAVARELGVGPDERLSFARDIGALVRAIIRHENGQQPYSTATIDAAVRAAG